QTPLARSNYDPGQRVNLAVSYDFKIGRVGATASLFYNGQSGRPYSFVFNGDANGDGRTGNDLLYVPSGPDDVIIRNGTWEQLDAFIAGDDALSGHRGQILPRNAGRAPWSNAMDLRLAAKIPTVRTLRL